jgi:DNA-binding transcriptional LysR family regulator
MLLLQGKGGNWHQRKEAWLRCHHSVGVRAEECSPMTTGFIRAVIPKLDQFLPPDRPFHLYYANRAHTPSKLRAFIEFMQAANLKVPK